MIPNSIIEKMNEQLGAMNRPDADREKVLQCLGELGLDDEEHQQIRDFFLCYNLSGVISKTSLEELMDLASPTAQIAEVTAFVQDAYQVREEYICLTSGEGEGFFLYSKTDRKIYDVGVDELDALEAGQLEARWNSFFELLEWYL